MKWLRRAGRRREPEAVALRAELELVLEENLRLRLEHQRALDAARGQERIRALRSVASDPDEADDSWHSLAELQTMRQSLLAACRELQLTIAAVERRCTGAPPPQELDRRVLPERREAERSAPVEASSGRAHSGQLRAAR